MAVSESEKVIRALYQITSDHNKGFEHQVTQLLKLGCERFNLDLGILSAINGNDYKVVYNVSPPEIGLENGARFDLDRTYCSVTMQANGPVGFEHVKEHEMSSHPAYLDFGLESYIGTPVYVDDKVYGTFNFSSPHPRQRKFKSVDLDALRLMASWLGAEISRQDKVRQLEEANAKLHELSITDGLTELYNRRHFQNELHRYLHMAKRYNQSLSLVMLDIDFFKHFNDDYGHSEGDNILIRFAEILTKRSRGSDFVARVGGEEFVILLPATDKSGAKILAEIVRSSIESHNWEIENVTASFGIETLNLYDHARTSIENLADHFFKNADLALYQAKAQGRNQCIHFQEFLKEQTPLSIQKNS